MEAKETYYDWSSWQQESRVRREIKRPSIEGKRPSKEANETYSRSKRDGLGALTFET